MASVTDSFAELSGISMQNCSSFCNAEKCVISSRGVCAHPAKGGPQLADIDRPEVRTRYAEACQIIGMKNKFEVAP
jgi:hypothetical protein